MTITNIMLAWAGVADDPAWKMSGAELALLILGIVLTLAIVSFFAIVLWRSRGDESDQT